MPLRLKAVSAVRVKSADSPDEPRWKLVTFVFGSGPVLPRSCYVSAPVTSVILAPGKALLSLPTLNLSGGYMRVANSGISQLTAGRNLRSRGSRTANLVRKMPPSQLLGRAYCVR